ncbi:MAG: uncharacterized protein QOE96_1694 [Blastocatellia bacterium]|jgi:uncharacterized protein YfaT (DUF1175 family)|nr:uncharacterized protein [Blastocatellia bacterium]
MLISNQIHALSKRSVTTASILIVLLATLGWSFSRLLPRARGFAEAPALAKQKAEGSKQKAGKENIQSEFATVSTGTATLIDSDNDGIPDAAELHTFQDRDNFRRWFTAIAETQFYQLSEQWNAEQRDCAGLVRFAIREALRRHDRIWFQKMGPGYETVAPDVAGFDLDQNALGEKIFRTDFGSFHESDLRNGRFSEFADGRSLKNFNSVFVSRDRREAQPGDLLFYYQPWVQKFPYHVMIMLGSPHIAPNGGQDWVVYHTGSSPTDQGTVKKVQLSVLDHHPDPRWRPVESNKNFLGFYRLKVLN